MSDVADKKLFDPEHGAVEPAIFVGWRFHSGAAVVNLLQNRLQLVFSFAQHPDEEQRAQLKKCGFRYARTQNYSWQRPLEKKAIAAAAQLPWLWPCSGKSPLDIQPVGLYRQDLEWSDEDEK